jgi:hypothetical protein
MGLITRTHGEVRSSKGERAMLASDRRGLWVDVAMVSLSRVVDEEEMTCVANQC